MLNRCVELRAMGGRPALISERLILVRPASRRGKISTRYQTVQNVC